MDISSVVGIGQLAKLAQSGNPKKRDDLMVALGSLCAVQPSKNPATRDVFGEILYMLNDQASDTARQQTSTILCSKPWAPRPLVLKWARDIIPVANPVLLKSPILTIDDLVDLANSTSKGHRLAIAARPAITEPVTGTLAGKSEFEVMSVMVDNDTASMNVETFATCVRVSRRHAELRHALSQREDIPKSLLPSLFTYSSKEERQEMAGRLGLDAENFSHVVREAIQERSKELENAAKVSKEREIAKLVAKLAKADKLSGELLTQAALEENTLLFTHAIAQMSGISVKQFRASMQQAPVRALSLASRAAGVDRHAFPAMYKNLFETGFIKQALTGKDAVLAARAYSEHSISAAAVALRLIAPNA